MSMISYIDDGFSGLASRTDSKISCESLSVQSGSFPSSLASSAHTSPRHLSPYDAFQNSSVAADNNPRNKDLDSSNNNAAEENESQKETSWTATLDKMLKQELYLLRKL